MSMINIRHRERTKRAWRSRHWIAASLALLAITFVSVSVYAQEEAAVQADAAPQGDLDVRLALAKKMHEFRPVKEQVDKAIEAYVVTLPEQQREVFRTALQNALNYGALEKISVDAMMETYTEGELTAMVEFYTKPEARSASDKYDQYAAKVYPEIGKMLDQALMRLKTGGSAP